MTAIKNRTPRGIRDRIPQGYILGRTSAQEGAVELIPIADLGQQLVQVGVVQAGPGGPGGNASVIAADFAIFWSGKTSATLVFAQFDLTLGVTIPASLAGSFFTARVAATSDYVVTLNQNGSAVATITYHSDGSVTVVAAAAITFAVGDQLQLVGQATADSTLADIGFAFSATKV